MLFTTLEFILFIAVCIVLYFCLPKKIQWIVLLLASLFFYYSIAKKLLIFVVFSSVTGYISATLLQKLNDTQAIKLLAAKQQNASKEIRAKIKSIYLRRRVLNIFAFSFINFGMLIVLKFYNLFVSLMTEYSISFPILRLALPLGISFYTLQLYSYIIDVSNQKVKAEKNPLKVLLFTAYFPQIMQGPISRFDKLAPELFSAHNFDYKRFVLGFERILWGYFKKLVIADRLNIFTTALYSGYETYTGFYVIVAAFAYTIQLYADFSGGIDIALGLSQIFGIDLPENFLRPLFSKSISEFWRRWHITLGAWLRDYIFYPLTLSKPSGKISKWFMKHKMRFASKWVATYCAMLFTWIISGIWHGAGWQFICNGLWHGAIIMLEMTFEKPMAGLMTKCGVSQQSLTLKYLRVARTFCLVAVGEIMFRAENTLMMTGMLKGLFAQWNPWILFDGSLMNLGLDAKDFIVGVIAVFVLLAASLISRKCNLREYFYNTELPVRWCVWLVGIMSIVIFGVYGPGYDPTPFIYFKF